MLLGYPRTDKCMQPGRVTTGPTKNTVPPRNWPMRLDGPAQLFVSAQSPDVQGEEKHTTEPIPHQLLSRRPATISGDVVATRCVTSLLSPSRIQSLANRRR